MLALQLDFFKSEEQCEIDLLKETIDNVKKSNDKVRKKLFAENGILKKEIIDLKSRMEILEKNICLGNITLSQS